MAGIKDKVVTVESLKELHEYNKEAYVSNKNTIPIKNGGTDATTAADALANLGGINKNGDNVTGALIFDNNISIKAKDVNGDAYNLIHMSPNNRLQIGYGLPDSYCVQINPFMRLSSKNYGDELPEAGTVGRIFFKRLTDV